MGDIRLLNLLVLFYDYYNRTLTIRGNDLRDCADAQKGHEYRNVFKQTSTSKPRPKRKKNDLKPS